MEHFSPSVHLCGVSAGSWFSGQEGIATGFALMRDVGFPSPTGPDNSQSAATSMQTRETPYSPIFFPKYLTWDMVDE